MGKNDLMNIDDNDDNLPHVVKDMKTRVNVGRFHVTNTSTPSSTGTFKSVGVEGSFKIENFKKNFAIHLNPRTDEKGTLEEYRDGENSLVLDMVGIDAPLANAVRRILIAEIPTMAIERVAISNNTSVVQDEVLAHRLGLIPIFADPAQFQYKKRTYVRMENGEEFDEVAYDANEHENIYFKLRVECKRDPQTKAVINSKVYSRDLEWVPLGDQAQRFANNPIKVVYGDILLAKLNPGQVIDIECYCEKNIGKEHAKWSPVATASYRLLPAITFKKPVKNELADQLKKMCPLNVFDVEDLGNGERQAVVARPRDCSMCRECIREDDWDERVQLSRVKNHFIFSIESTGILQPERIFRESLQKLKEKCLVIKDHLQQLAETQ